MLVFSTGARFFGSCGCRRGDVEEQMGSSLDQGPLSGWFLCFNKGAVPYYLGVERGALNRKP